MLAQGVAKLENIEVVQSLTSYGALGVVAIYFMVKDYTVTKEWKTSLQEFTNILHEIKGRIIQ